MRVLVTGSRDWNDPWLIERYLLCFHTWIPARLVSGACPRGADAIAERIASDLGWEIERYPAQWVVNGKYDRAAGFKRNKQMVDLGADVCLAFILNQSRGASMTARLAEQAGIRTLRVELNNRVPH